MCVAPIVQKIEKLRQSLHCLEAPATERTNKHTVFVDSMEEAVQFDPVKYFDTVPELVDRSFNRPRIETLQNEEVQGATDTVRTYCVSHVCILYRAVRM